MGWPKATKIKGLDKVYITHICLFFFILSSVCLLPVYAQSELIKNPSSLTGPEKITDGCESLTPDAHLMVQESLEYIIEQNNDLEQTLGYSSDSIEDQMEIDGYMVTLNAESLPIKMVDLDSEKEIIYEYFSVNNKGDKAEPASQAEINRIEITTMIPPDIEVKMALEGKEARAAVAQMRSFVANAKSTTTDGVSGDPDPTATTKPKEGDAPSIPDLIARGKIVAEMAELFESLQYELDNLKEEESEASKAKVQDKKAASSGNQLSEDSIEARRKIYNKIYYTKIQRMLNRKGLSSDYNITSEGHLRIFLTPSVKKK